MIIYNLVIGIAANKSDLIEKEQVNEKEARQYAKDINAIFKVTSAAFTSAGIDELFKSIGCKILDPNYTDEEGSSNPATQTQNKIEQKPEIKEEKKKIEKTKPKEKEKRKEFC